MSTPAQAKTDDLATALRHAASLLEKDPALAEQQALEILKPFPNDANGLTLLGTAQRLQRKFDAALRTLRMALARAPDFPLAHQEFGLTLMALDRADDAVKALRQAVDLQPKLPLAWKALADILSAQGEKKESRKAYRRHLAATVKHPELVQAGDHLFAGRIGKAEALCREVLKKDPVDVSAIRMLASIAIKLGRYEDADKLLTRCLELAPDFHLARNDYANALSKRQQYKPALAELEKLLAVEPDNPNHLMLKASVLVNIGDFQPAIDLYDRVLARYPKQPRAHLSNGHALKTVGRQDDSIAAYRKAIELEPSLGEAFWSLANLKTFRFEDNEVDAMREQVLGKPDNPQDFFHLCFALGKSLEDRREFHEAFRTYKLGNAVRRKTVSWDADDHHRNMQKLAKFFDAGFFREREDSGCKDDSPIFIVGLPRAGSTLLEQILASHSQVEGTMELPDIISIARRLGGKKARSDESRYPQIVGEQSTQNLTELGEEYLERTKIQRSGSPFFIDKMPNNFSHVGLIHVILPNAKIIDARRHPIGGCFSAFKQLFARGQNFTYDLTEIGRYYRDYVELMDHWDQVLPGRVLRMQYEDIVSDTENEVRRLLDYCGLDFEPDCLRFYQTERAIRTPSSEQVRQPIYGDATEHWRNYEDHLGELVAALGPVMERYPVEANSGK
jgi:tetratricopeptide (TPR) repeat protein